MENKFTDYYRLGGIGGINLGRENFKDVREIPWDIQRSLCVNPSKKLIYYKPGKAAGTSIFRVTLQPMGGWIIQKDNPNEFSNWMKNITDEEIDKYFTFIFVRNPFARLVSYWNSTHRAQPFKEYVKQKDRIFKDGVPTFLHHQTQSSLVETPDGTKSNLNFIGKVENINDDWYKLCSIINIPPTPLVHHRSGSQPYEYYTSFYDEETIAIVTEMYKRDLEVFDYKFK
jgi:hypothetical protein